MKLALESEEDQGMHNFHVNLTTNKEDPTEIVLWQDLPTLPLQDESCRFDRECFVMKPGGRCNDDQNSHSALNDASSCYNRPEATESRVSNTVDHLKRPS